MDKNEKQSCLGCLIFIFIFIFFLIPLFIDFCLSAWYVEKHNAPFSCVFSRDTIMCVQLSKKEPQ